MCAHGTATARAAAGERYDGAMAERRDDADGAEAPAVQLSSDRYQLEKQLGTGGMATVYRAWDDHAKDWVAIKMLNPSLADRPKVRRRFEIEALALQKLDHRNIIKVLDTELEGDRPFIVMELAEGGCLIDWIREYGPLPPRMAVDAAIQVCKGVAVAHAQGIVHRDIKPHNILMNHRGVCKLTDFGIAQLDAEGFELTRSGVMMGTLGYVAPEQLDDASSVDEATDVYSIGATLFAVVTGTLPPNDLYMRDPWDPCFDGIEQPLLMVIVQATRRSRSQRVGAVSTLQNMLRRVLPQLPPDPPSTPSIAELAALRGFTDPSRSAPRRLLASLRTRVPVPSRNSAADTFVSPLPSPCRMQQPSTVPGAPERQARPSPPTRRGWASLFRNLTGACETTGA